MEILEQVHQRAKKMISSHEEKLWELGLPSFEKRWLREDLTNVYQCLKGRWEEDGPSSVQWCWAKEQEQQAETHAQQVPPEHEVFLYFVGDQAVEQIAQRDNGVSFTGDI